MHAADDDREHAPNDQMHRMAASVTPPGIARFRFTEAESLNTGEKAKRPPSTCSWLIHQLQRLGGPPTF